MERLSDRAIEIINELHTDRLDHESEYLPLIDCANKCSAYEDTGLEPEEIIELKARMEREKVNKCSLFDIDFAEIIEDAFGIPVDRLYELASAEREGRCLVLPCKKGDTVWRIVHDATPHITKDRCTNIKVENREVWISLIGDRVMGGWNFGKLLFLSKKEAEEALKAREQDG